MTENAVQEVYAAPAAALRKVASVVRSLDFSARDPKVRPARKRAALSELKRIAAELEALP